MNILVTGGLGQIGSYVSNILSHENDVTVIDNFSNNIKNKVIPPNIKIIKGDICNRVLIKDLCNYDMIVHLAAQISVDKSINNPIYDADNNISGTLNLLEMSRKSDMRNFVYISSAAVYGRPEYVPIDEIHPTNPISPYGLSKLTGERYSMLYYDIYGLSVTCLRLFNVYSPFQDPNNPYSGVIIKFINKVKNSENPIIFGDGSQTRDFVYIEDVANAIFKTIENKKAIGKVFNIGSGKPTRIKDLADIVIGLLGKNVSSEFLQPKIGDIIESYANITNARDILSYEPKYTLEEGLRLMLNNR